MMGSMYIQGNVFEQSHHQGFYTRLSRAEHFPSCKSWDLLSWLDRGLLAWSGVGCASDV